MNNFNNKNKKIIIGDLEVTGEVIAKKQQNEYNQHKHNMHTTINIPITHMYIDPETPDKLIVKSNYQTVYINGETSIWRKNAQYITSNNEIFNTIDGKEFISAGSTEGE